MFSRQLQSELTIRSRQQREKSAKSRSQGEQGMAFLSVSLLGDIQVERDGHVVTDFSTDKSRALLAYLAIESDRSHRRQALAGLLWPGFPERAARTSLRTALASLRRVIGDRQAKPPYLITSRQTVAINPASNIWVDAKVISRLFDLHKTLQPGPNELEDAVRLYRGKFLAGFSLADSAQFDDWVLLQRERLERCQIWALEWLTRHYNKAGNVESALAFARRWVEVDPWQESAQRELMWTLAASGRRLAALAQYERCQQLLREELGVEPEPKTTRLYEAIRDRRLDIVELSTYPAVSRPATASMRAEAVGQFADKSAFVGRKRELKVMYKQLQKATAGHGSTVFVIGGAGRGKTALLEEFSGQVAERFSCFVAAGYCNAYSGRGDPYLPFQHLLEQLTGDTDSLLAGGQAANTRQALLSTTMADTIRTIVEDGQDLIGTFLAGSRLLERASAALTDEMALISRLRLVVEAKTAERQIAEPRQYNLIDQYVRVLRRVALRTPLLLVIEDLHWADQGSLELLLHLGRRLAGRRLLVLCAFRPDELTNSSGQARHPLKELVSELTALYGDIVIDLAQADKATGRSFVEELLDVEPNRLDERFRRALYERTDGHPLFTVEMLRMLKEQGEIVRDPGGRWATSGSISWDQMPAKVEAVIKKRVDRLAPSTQALLAVASVEGEVFSAEVVAAALRTPTRQILNTLSATLSARHRLVQEIGASTVGEQSLSRFRFSHHLFQRYVYGSLSASERRLLHEEIAQAYEWLFSANIDPVTVPLAYHYSQTGLDAKTLQYLTAAGQHARRKYDGQQALEYFTRALLLLPEDSSERFQLLAARASVYDQLAQRDHQQSDIDAMLAIAVRLKVDKLHCDALLAMSGFYLATEIFLAREPAQEAREIAQSIGDSVREAQALRLLSWEGRLGADFQTARRYLEEAANRFTEADMPGEAADSLFMLARRLPGTAKHIFDLEAAEQAMDLSRQSGDRRLQAAGLKNLAIAYASLDKDEYALPLVEEALKTQSELGDRREQCNTLDVSGVVLARLGRRQEAAAMFQRCLSISEEDGFDWGVLGAVFGYWNYCFIVDGEYERFLAFLDERLEMARKAGRDWLAGFLSWPKTKITFELGRVEEAYALAQANEYWVTEGDPVSHVFVVMLAGSIKAGLGQLEEARQDLELALATAESTADEYLISWPLVALANVAIVEGEPEKMTAAVKQLERATKAAKAVRDERHLAEVLDTNARLHLALGQSFVGAQMSTELMELMATYYWLPRPQNYMYTHAQAMQATAHETEYQHHLQLAHDRVMLVAEKLASTSARTSWLNNVRVNREIVRCWQDVGSDS